jgi:hypothetical protein
MAATIPQKFNIVRFQRYLLIYFLNLLSVAGLGDFNKNNNNNNSEKET